MQNDLMMIQRITVLEQEVKTLNNEVNELKEDNKKIIGKLDELLELRSKGMGVVWLLSGLFGTGLIGIFYTYFGR